MVYTHIVDRGPLGVISPLDTLIACHAQNAPPPDPTLSRPPRSSRRAQCTRGSSWPSSRLRRAGGLQASGGRVAWCICRGGALPSVARLREPSDSSGLLDRSFVHVVESCRSSRFL